MLADRLASASLTAALEPSLVYPNALIVSLGNRVFVAAGENRAILFERVHRDNSADDTNVHAEQRASEA